jgi:hypothetical protein
MKITGDNNIVIQDSFKKNKETRSKNKYQLIAICIAIASLIVAIIVGREKLLSFICSIFT